MNMVGSDQFVICQAALIFALTRWLLSLALSLLTNFYTQTSSTSHSCRSSPTPHSSTNTRRTLRESLTLTTLGRIEHRVAGSHDRTCAVCLNQLKKDSQVWELRNCRHVFHRQCLERWLCYDDRLSCPLCRASLVADCRQSPAAAQPSWAVERMLYLFGDDLLP